MICKKCGAGLRENSKYCEACGSKSEIESPLIMVENEYDGMSQRVKRKCFCKIFIAIGFVVIVIFATFFLVKY